MPIVSAPHKVPGTLGRPGSNIVMPSNTAAIDVSMKSPAEFGAAEARLAVISTAAIPAARPESASPSNLTRRTGIPARRAASSAWPTVSMRRPVGVNLSKNHAASTSNASHTMRTGTPISVPRPIHRKCGFQAPTKATPCVIMKAKPLAIEAVARVAISDGTFTHVTRIPLSTPAASPTDKPAATAIQTGWLLCTSQPTLTEATLQTLANDRSSSAVVSASENPNASTARKLMCLTILVRLPTDKKLGAKIANNRNSTQLARNVP